MCEILSDCHTGFGTPRRLRQWEDEVSRLQRAYLTGAHKLLSYAEQDQQRASTISPPSSARAAASPARGTSPMSQSPRPAVGRGPIKGLHGLALCGGSHPVQLQQQQPPVSRPPHGLRRDGSPRAFSVPGESEDAAAGPIVPSSFSIGARLASASPRRFDAQNAAVSLPHLASARPPPSTQPRLRQQHQPRQLQQQQQPQPEQQHAPLRQNSAPLTPGARASPARSASTPSLAACGVVARSSWDVNSWRWPGGVRPSASHNPFYREQALGF